MDNDLDALKKEIQQLKDAVRFLQNQVTVLSKAAEQQRFVNDQVNNNIRRVAASRR